MSLTHSVSAQSDSQVQGLVSTSTMARCSLRTDTAVLCAAAIVLACTLGARAQGSASVAASGNARATASENGNVISVAGSPCPANWVTRCNNYVRYRSGTRRRPGCTHSAVLSTGRPGCGATATEGSNAYAFASGTPVANVVVQWGLGEKLVPLNLCTGSNISFEWNTGSATEVYGLYQIASATCPASFADQKLLVTPASAPSPTNQVSINLAKAGPVCRLSFCACSICKRTREPAM